MYSSYIGNMNWLSIESCGCIFKDVIFKGISWIDSLDTSCDIALRLMSPNIFVEYSTLVQIMLDALGYKPIPGPMLVGI